MRSRMREDVADGRDGSLTDQYCGRTELLLTDPVSIAETWWGLQNIQMPFATDLWSLIHRAGFELRDRFCTD